MKFAASHIVVDADIARAASSGEHPAASNARHILEAIRASDLKLGQTGAIREEWKKHRSTFSARWQATMIASRRTIELAVHTDVKSQVLASELNDKDKKIAAKDAHLLDASLADTNPLNHFLVSSDNQARMVFCRLAHNAHNLKSCFWAIPNTDLPQFLSLLQDGGYVPAHWFLGSSPHPIE